MKLSELIESLNFNHIVVEQENDIATVTLDSGHRANAFCLGTMKELTELADMFSDCDDVHCVILTGKKQIFSGGMDLSDPIITQPKTRSIPELRKASGLGAKMCKAWESMDAITISAIEGYCVGAGVALSLSLDFRVTAKSSVMYVPEIERGMSMSWQSVPRSVNLIGPAKTKRMFILADKVDGTMAHDWGWSDYLCSDGEALKAATEIAGKVASRPKVVVGMCKQSINMAAQALNNAVSYMDIDQFVLSQHTSDYSEGINSYLEKRESIYTGK